jgi:phytoene synthase
MNATSLRTAPRVDAPESLSEALETVRAGLHRVAVRLRREGIAVPRLEGKLLRPVVAYAMVPPTLRSSLDDRFWSGALAVQMVHEASLLHDDILDGAPERRGAQTVVAQEGVETALVLGDHYLTGAYRAAAAAEIPEFLLAFIRAVERTVAGEIAQGRSAGARVAPDTYDAIIRGKSGELFGAAAVLGGAFSSLGDLPDRVEIGCRLGALYQRVDDLLDYCPAAKTGKPPLQDYRQGKWTWVLDLMGVEELGLQEVEIIDRLFRAAQGPPSPAERALECLRERRRAIVDTVRSLAPGDTLVEEVLDGWVSAAVDAVRDQVDTGETDASRSRAGRAVDEVRRMAGSLGGPGEWRDYFGRHARTFRFAARLFPAEAASRIAGLYAYCRFTDDLVDEPGDGDDPIVLAERLDAWRQLSRAAFEGEATGIPLLDVVLGDARTNGVSWRYPDALLEGVRMDLDDVRFADWDDLERYTFAVAGAVGGWVTQLFGLSEPELLERAHALGHGMQLTNILRDVGEDLDRGRLYLPTLLLHRHGLNKRDLVGLQVSEGPMPGEYRELIEDVMHRADEHYRKAWPGIHALPAWYGRPVAVAARAYQGIHDEIRRNGHDNLTRRASTSLAAKMSLAASGLLQRRRGG